MTFLAWIVPVQSGGGYPDQGLPPGQGGYPSHPIYQPPYPSQGLPPYPSQGLPPGQGGYPSHPIYQPPYPSQGLPPYPSQGLPGGPPPYPSQGLPGGSGGYPSQGPGFPTQLPMPGGPGVPPAPEGKMWAFVPGQGWVLVDKPPDASTKPTPPLEGAQPKGPMSSR
jgi:hypothetical protein